MNPGATEVPNNGIDEDCDGMDGTTSTLSLGGNELNIYPNPVNEILFIDGNIEGYKYSLISISGQIVQDGRVTNQIDLSSIDNGIYFLQVGSGENSKTIKLVLL